jgi:hypothetical protein
MSFWKSLNIVKRGISGNYVPMSAKTEIDMIPTWLCSLSLSLSLSLSNSLFNQTERDIILILYFPHFYFSTFTYNKCTVSVVIETSIN